MVGTTGFILVVAIDPKARAIGSAPVATTGSNPVAIIPSQTLVQLQGKSTRIRAEASSEPEALRAHGAHVGAIAVQMAGTACIAEVIGEAVVQIVIVPIPVESTCRHVVAQMAMGTGVMTTLLPIGEGGELNPKYGETFEFETNEAERTAGCKLEARLIMEVWDDNPVCLRYTIHQRHLPVQDWHTDPN